MTADFASSSPEALENAELLKTVGWGMGGPQPFGKERVAATRFSRRRNRGPRDAFFPSWGGAEADHEMRPERQGASGTRAPVESCVMPGGPPHV